MKYIKQPLTILQQIEKLKLRGLIIDDKDIASNYLSNISYYRLRAYTYPFQDNNNLENDHCFIRDNIHFNDIIDLYCFDRRLRALIFNAIEKIEVAIRTKITYQYAISTKDSHWFMNESLFHNTTYYKEKENGEKKEIFKYNKLLDDIQHEINRSREDFITHYAKFYTNPDMPPAWMSLEVISLGTLSRLYELLKKDNNKKEIAQQFGLSDISILENWLHAIANLRNCCAHHSRIWNRRFITQIKLPYNTTIPFMDRDTISKTKQNKLFAILSCIKYILDIISPNNDFKSNFLTLVETGGKLLSLKEMGFPNNWKYLDVWINK
ncbi:abortive infection bacteriophage resistance protein [Dysgonomonadaceae bacterium PH5-43]|nr:abortive infection bacteriophage resistance protein [Dysgonomonadaceae bacterium PH5-43]